jgi:hypothetical protein
MLNFKSVDFYIYDCVPVEIMTTASELRMKMGKLNTNLIEETGKVKAKRIDNNKMDISAIYASKGNQNIIHSSAT